FPHAYLIHENIEDKVIAFKRADLLFVFNFHSTHSHVDYPIEVQPGKYKMIFDSDALEYGGHGRLQSNQSHLTLFEPLHGRKRNFVSLYLPVRSAIVLLPVTD
ncbi:MAG: 1,4-alpha-glucan-branching enzyme, partial [bacterium]|nr:1,4-alpha-glucan-branching enzyme [bacterium]